MSKELKQTDTRSWTVSESCSFQNVACNVCNANNDVFKPFFKCKRLKYRPNKQCGIQNQSKNK